MKTIVTFPICDLRRYVGGSSTYLQRPSWTLPERHKDFIRALGGLKPSAEVGLSVKGLSGWIMEPFVCDAKHGPKFHDLPAMHIAGGTCQWKIDNRLLFFDGECSGRVEYHFFLDLKGQTEAVSFDAINDFLCDMKLKFRKHEGEGKTEYDEVDFGRSGLLHANALAARTVARNKFLELHEIRKNIKFMRPSIVHVIEPGEMLDFRGDFIKVKNTISKYLEVYHDRVRVFSNIDIPVWAILTKDKLNGRDLRDLVLYLRRLHAEYECIKVLLRAVESGAIPTEGGVLPEDFEEYLLEVLGRVRSAEQRFDRVGGFAPDEQASLPKIADLASISIHDLDPTLHRQIQVALRRAKFKWKSNQNQILAALKVLEERSVNVNFNVRNLNVDNSQNVSNSTGIVQTQAGRDAQVNLDKSFNGFQEKTSSAEVVQAIADLKELLDQAIETGEVKDPESVARDFDDMAQEAASEVPRKQKIEFNGKMIVGALKESSSLISAISKAVEVVGSFFK
ncbi:hypothetical protein PVW47_07890 [Marinovum sp. SP66]|nr:hypothetical protein [Marinovum sp. SP66]